MKLSNYFGIGILIILFIVIITNYTDESIVPIYPKNNSIVLEIQPTFKWIGKANKLILDDNEEFVSPVIENVKGNSHKISSQLDFATYYWKLVGENESAIFQFKIDSIVALKLKNVNYTGDITNIGTAELDVEVVEENNSLWTITGNFILRLNETKQFNVKNKSIFVGKQR